MSVCHFDELKKKKKFPILFFEAEIIIFCILTVRWCLLFSLAIVALATLDGMAWWDAVWKQLVKRPLITIIIFIILWDIIYYYCRVLVAFCLFQAIASLFPDHYSWMSWWSNKDAAAPIWFAIAFIFFYHPSRTPDKKEARPFIHATVLSFQDTHSCLLLLLAHVLFNEPLAFLPCLQYWWRSLKKD